jgi:ribonuclease HIII
LRGFGCSLRVNTYGAVLDEPGEKTPAEIGEELTQDAIESRSRLLGCDESGTGSVYDW